MPTGTRSEVDKTSDEYLGSGVISRRFYARSMGADSPFQTALFDLFCGIFNIYIPLNYIRAVFGSYYDLTILCVVVKLPFQLASLPLNDIFQTSQLESIRFLDINMVQVECWF